MLQAIGFVIMILMAIAILGPEKLPIGVEAIALNLLNFNRSHNGQPPLSLEEAQEYWSSSDSFIFSITTFLRAAEEHLVELRGRIFRTGIAVAIAAVIAAVASNYILEFLIAPSGARLVFLRPTEMFGTYITVIVTTALGLSIPVILYQVLAFIRPALESPQEERVFRLVVFVAAPFTMVFLAAGIAFAYIVLLPFALRYLGSFGAHIAEATWNIGSYISFVTNMLFWIGVAFETPLVMFVLARAGIVSAERFSKMRKGAYVAIAAASAVITPTPDAVNMLLVMGPLVLLYELGILLAKIGRRPREASEEQEGEEPSKASQIEQAGEGPKADEAAEVAEIEEPTEVSEGPEAAEEPQGEDAVGATESEEPVEGPEDPGSGRGTAAEESTGVSEELDQPGESEDSATAPENMGRVDVPEDERTAEASEDEESAGESDGDSKE
jgi:sec-independent protein translocase protein TatC